MEAQVLVKSLPESSKKKTQVLKDTQDSDPGFLRERLSMLALRYASGIKMLRECYARLRVTGKTAKTVIVEELVDDDFAASRFGASAGPVGIWKAGGNHGEGDFFPVFPFLFFSSNLKFDRCCSIYCEKRLCSERGRKQSFCCHVAAGQQLDQVGALAMEQLEGGACLCCSCVRLGQFVCVSQLLFGVGKQSV